MKTLPDQETLQELLELGKNYEQQARKLYEKAEGFAQKWEIRLKNKQKENGSLVGWVDAAATRYNINADSQLIKATPYNINGVASLRDDLVVFLINEG